MALWNIHERYWSYEEIKTCCGRDEDGKRLLALEEHGKGSTSDKRKTDGASSGHRSGSTS
jgi:hypothetical protein